jgi:hypothetical protein
MKLVKEYHDAMAESAGRLAPYIHPRLAAVEVKTEQPQSFVICVPEVETDSERWARAAHKAKLINSKADRSGE